MGKFNKIKKHSKAFSYIDEKIESLNVELNKTFLGEAPTNNTAGVYVKEPESKDIETVTINPDPVLNLNADDATQSGTDTTGIFDEFGNSVLIDPPGVWEIPAGPTLDPSANLGPMISYYDTPSNTTYLGYVRQSDRSMVNLGRITGQMSSWNGTSNFVSYGQLTLSQAQWYQSEYNSGKVQDYRVFYSGKSDNSDPYHRVLGKMINTPKGSGSNPWSVYTTTPISSDQQITVKFYFDNGSLYTGARPPIFYDTNTGLPNGITAVDTVNFTVPAGDGVTLQQGQNSGGFNVSGIGLKWRYLRGPENPFGHDEPDGDPNGVSTWYHPDDYFVWYMTINGKNYPLPAGLQGMSAAIGIPGGFGNWSKGSANSKAGGSGSQTKQQEKRVPPKMGGFDKNLPSGSARPKKKSDFKSDADYAAYKAGGGDAAAKKGLSVNDIIKQGNKNLYDKYVKSLPPGVRNDMLKGGKTSSPVGDAALTLAIAAGLRGGVSAAKYAANVSKPATGLARGTKGAQIGATGLKKPGFEALKNAENLHKGSKGLLSPGGKGVYSAPKVGQVGPGGLSPGSGAARYSRAGSNPAGGAQGKSGQPGGVVGSVTPGGARGTNFIEPQKVVNPQQFQKGQQLFQKIQGGQYPNSALANKLRQQAGQAGFKPGQTNVPYNQLPVSRASSGAGQNALKGAAAIGALNSGPAKGQGVSQLPSDLKTKIDKGEPLTNKDFDTLKQYMDSQKSQGQKPQQVNSLSKISNVTSTDVKSLADKLSNVKPGSSKESSLKKQASKILDTLSPDDPNYIRLLNLLAPTTRKESFNLTEDHIKILQNIKKPYQLPEEKREKIKHRPRVIGAAPRTVGEDLMNKVEVPKSFKPMEETMWGKNEKYVNARLSQERKNQVLDFVGTSDHAWEWITETIRKKGNQVAYENFSTKNLDGDILYTIKDDYGNSKNVLQSEVDDAIYNSYFGKYLKEQETLQATKDPLFKKVSKRLQKEIDYPDKPSKLGYPDQPPPKMIDGWHPDYGQKSDYYNRLDPQSADSMPDTGNSEIDAKVRRAKILKKALGKKV